MTRHAKTLLSTTFVLGFAALGLAACDSGGEKAASADPAVVKEAKEVWDTRCTNCHGADGKGNGPGAVALNPKPQSSRALDKSSPDLRPRIGQPDF